MAEKEQSTDTSAHEMTGTNDPSGLGRTLVKSPQWVRNTLRALESARSGSNEEHGSGPLIVQSELLGIRAELKQRTAEMKSVRQKLREQSATLRRRGSEIDRLRQTVIELEFANARLSEEHQAELEARRTELSELQSAYDQFEQQSDELLAELDNKNDLLRQECKRRNKLSLL